MLSASDNNIILSLTQLTFLFISVDQSLLNWQKKSFLKHILLVILFTASFTKQENELCRTVMAYWGNFAHTGWVKCCKDSNCLSSLLL